MKKEDFNILVAKIKEETKPEAIESAGGFNAFLMAIYKEETGQTVFRTFNAWKAEGYKVVKGESSFPIFSRPIAAIKEERGEEPPAGAKKYFGIAHLFHFGQVEKI